MRTALGILMAGGSWGTALAQPAAETYLALYLAGSKIGHSSYLQVPDRLNGKDVNRSVSKTVMEAGLLGSAVKIEIESITWTDGNGNPLKMTYSQTSAGRGQTVEARFGATKIECKIDNNGVTSTKSIAIPKDSVITDDPLNVILAMPTGTKRKVYVLDPTTVSLLPNEVVVKGKSTTKVFGKDVSANLIEVRDPRATMKVFLSEKGDLVKVDAPMGIEMIPVSAEEALAKPDAYKPTPDLAFATSLGTDRPIQNPTRTTFLDLRISGPDLSRAPSDDHQTVKQEGEGWRVTVHPPKIESSGVTIDEAAAQQSKWVQGGMYVPSQSETFTKLAGEIVGNRKRVMDAARAIQLHVYEVMRPNAGIGVLRDATEVLKSKEGVCRDYAILTATLLRAARIPTRMASGLVSWDGQFFYHAWVEVWNGKQWIGVDSTTPSPQISATHVKLASGNVEDAFTFQFLEKAKIEVLEVK